MSQVLNQEAEHSDEYYKQEVLKLLAEMRAKNEKMERDQEEIKQLENKSRETLKRIEVKLQNIERILA